MSLNVKRIFLIGIACAILTAGAILYIRFRHIGTYVSDSETITLLANGRCKIAFDATRTGGLIGQEVAYKIRGGQILTFDGRKFMSPNERSEPYSTLGTISGDTITTPDGRHWKHKSTTLAAQKAPEHPILGKWQGEGNTLEFHRDGSVVLTGGSEKIKERIKGTWSVSEPSTLKFTFKPLRDPEFTDIASFTIKGDEFAYKSEAANRPEPIVMKRVK